MISAVEIFVGGVYMFHICFDLFVDGVGVCVDICSIVCVVEGCLFLEVMMWCSVRVGSCYFCLIC